MYSAVEIRSIFRLYSIYTLCISLLFLFLYWFDQDINWWKPIYPSWMPILLLAYLGLALANNLLSSRAYSQSNNQRQIDKLTPAFFGEVLILGSLLLVVAPYQKELSQVLFVTVGIANIVLSSKQGYLIAAMATIVVLTNAFLNKGDVPGNLVFESGLQGTLFFCEALLLHAFRRRLKLAHKDVASQQQELSKAARLNDLIIERMQTGICVVKTSGEIVSINRAAKERVGELFVGERIPTTLYERLQEWRDYKKQSDRPLFIGEPEVSVIASFAPIDNDTTLIYLEDSGTIAHKAQQFKLASLGRMAASIAHEIRNPLSAIGHAAQLMAECDYLEAEDRKLNDIIINHANRVELIIQNVLQISKRRPSNPESIDLLAWLNVFVEDFKKNHSITVEIEGKDLDIPFDRSQLHQVIWNLLENAIRYGSNDHGCQVHLRLFRHTLDNRPCLSVCDQGQGISADQKHYLFEPFHTTSTEGTGLGLYIIKELCEANQAEIRYYDDPDCGACFQILFAYSSRNSKNNIRE